MKTHAKAQRRKGFTVTSSTLCASAPLREANPAAGETATAVPTFALLCEKRRLRVRNPENGARFTISLRDWQSMLWAVRVSPEPTWRQPDNAYTTAHRILPRHRIEDWLAELQLADA
jgi:hypothetical protein